MTRVKKEQLIQRREVKNEENKMLQKREMGVPRKRKTQVKKEQLIQRREVKNEENIVA